MKALKRISGSLLLFIALSTFAQVQIDKPLQMTGSTNNNRQVKNIGLPSDTADAVSAKALQNSAVNYSIAGGTGNAITISLTPAPVAYSVGMVVYFKATANNSGATTLTVNSLSTVTIKKAITTDLASGDIMTGQMVAAIYDGTNFQLLSGGSSSGSTSTLNFSLSASSNQANVGQGFSTAATPLVLTATYLSGNSSAISINLTGLPTGVTYNMSPGGGFPGFTSQLVFTAQPTATLGSYTLTITATGGITPQTLTITLNVLPKKRVFFSSVDNYNGNLGGLSGADSKCQTLANAAGIGGNWTAFLSSSTVNAKDRITNAIYVTVGGTEIANGISGLTSGSVMIPIDTTEHDTYSSGFAWTGSNLNGTSYTNNYCVDWTSSSGSDNGELGLSYQSGNNWIFWSNQACNSTFGGLYCFEQ